MKGCGRTKFYKGLKFIVTLPHSQFSESTVNVDTTLTIN